MKRFALLLLCLSFTVPAYAVDSNLWVARGNPVSVIRQVTHDETTHEVTVYFRTAAYQDQTLPILCPPSLHSACLLGASPTTTPSLLATCTYVPYADVTVVGHYLIKRLEVWHCSTGVSQCQIAEAWLRDDSFGNLGLVATGGGGPTTGCSPK